MLRGRETKTSSSLSLLVLVPQISICKNPHEDVTSNLARRYTVCAQTYIQWSRERENNIISPAHVQWQWNSKGGGGGDWELTKGLLGWLIGPYNNNTQLGKKKTRNKWRRTEREEDLYPSRVKIRVHCFRCECFILLRWLSASWAVEFTSTPFRCGIKHWLVIHYVQRVAVESIKVRQVR